MASWSDLKFKLITTGDETGTWGDTTNANLGNAIEQAITGTVTVAFSDADVHLYLTDTTDLQDARALRLSLSGVASTTRTLYVPNIQKFYIIDNGLTEAITVQNETGAGTALTIPAGRSTLVFNTNTNIVNPNTYFAGAVLSDAAVILGGVINSTPIGNITPASGAFTTLSASGSLTSHSLATGTITATSISGLTTPLSIAQGGTGQITASLAINALVPTQTSNSGKFLSTDGSVVSWQSGFITGMIMMWSGTIATIPSGWLLCNGLNGTPDLRNRFVIGAFSDTAGVAYTTITGANTKTGGSKDATLVSHTHTATVTDPGHFHANQGTRQVQAGPDNSGPFVQEANWAAGGNQYNTSSKTTGISVSNATQGSSATDANLVPYYAVAFIMKS